MFDITKIATFECSYLKKSRCERKFANFHIFFLRISQTDADIKILKKAMSIISIFFFIF